MNSKKIFSSNKVPLTNLDLKVLKCLHNNGSYCQKGLVKECKSTISGISKALRRLIFYGIVYCIPHPIKIYNLVPERKDEVNIFLRGYDFGKNSPLIVDSHHYIFECSVKNFSKRFVAKLQENSSWIEFCPKNWVGYKKVYLDGSVCFRNTKSCVKARFYFRTFAKSPEEAEMINIQKFLDKKEFLEEKYDGLELGNQNLVATCPFQEVALLNDPLSRAAIREGIKHKNIEDSHRIGGEWEEKGPYATEKISRLIKLREEELAEI